MVRLLVLRSQAWLLSRVQAVSETGFFRLLLHRCPQACQVLSSPLFLRILPSPEVPGRDLARGFLPACRDRFRRGPSSDSRKRSPAPLLQLQVL